DNVVVLTGDIHSSWASDLPVDAAAYDPEGDAPAAAVEFVAPAISAFALPFLTDAVVRLLSNNNRHIKFFELTKRGFVRVDVTPERVHGDWYLYPDIEPETVPPPEHGAAFEVAAGAGRLVPVDFEAKPR
ncbi:MAG: alkaline phosphatase D family protein, partial [Myxococcales bacterium]|nr:alkaline phosphatase D family protein [Myxococcales bacterium]